MNMTKDEALYQSLASCGAVLIAFIGMLHEFAGLIIFPWALETLGGPIAWHGLGIFAIAAGLLMLGGTLRLIRFPVVPLALIAGAIGIVLVIFTAVAHHQFHMPALAGAVAGGVTAFFHQKALRQARAVAV